MKKPKQKVWVVLYEHRHGCDVSVARTKKKALAIAAHIVICQVEDGEIDGNTYEALKARRGIKRAYREGRHSLVVRKYLSHYNNTHMEGEYISIEGREIQ